MLDGSYVSKKGAPPRARGAWVAGLIVDNLLRQAGASKQAVALAADLVAVLLGRGVERSELYRVRKLTSHRNIQDLAQELACEYEYWVNQNSARANDLYLASHGPQEYALWRRRHRPLKALLKTFPGDQLAYLTLKRISISHWEPLWELITELRSERE
jgi:hypothetical protein